VAYRIPSDEEVLAATVKVVLAEGTVASQRRLSELVRKELKRRDAEFRVGEARVRALAVRSGVVAVTIHARKVGDGREVERCPVCGAKLRRTSNATLTGSSTPVGYRCTRCPWWTGRELRMPARYAFTAKVERRGKDAQVRFTK
jgi:uncharacterized protein with PIN domain